MNKYIFILIFVNLLNLKIRAEDLPANDLEEVNVSESLKKTISPSPSEKEREIKMSNLEEQDDLQSLKEDIGDVVFEKDGKKNQENLKENSKIADKEKVAEKVSEKEKEKEKEKDQAKDQEEVSQKKDGAAGKNLNLDVGNADKELLKLAKMGQKKINKKEWNDLAAKAKLEKYEVQKGDSLLQISEKLFGSSVYYAKIWALNPQIVNPYDLEPGTILTFDMGDDDTLPNVQLGEFREDDGEVVGKGGSSPGSGTSSVNSANQPSWLKERKKLISQGVYFQFASEETYEDLERLEKMQKNTEYEKYDPPLFDVNIKEPSEQYDSTGLDKNSKVIFNYKEGFYLNTFVTTNVVQDLGEIKATPKESVFIHKLDTVYVDFDKMAKVKPGDLFSVYTAGGEIKHVISDRSGFVYTTTAQIKVIKKIDDIWECLVVEQSGMVQRKDRVTVYTPPIGQILRTYSKRNVEAAIIGSYRESMSGIAYGDVVYLDRGRADGIELGNLFEIYSFVDRGTQRKITPGPTYKIGELTVINITDNFATALVTNSSNEINIGSIAITKSQEEAMRALRAKNKDKLKDIKKLEGNALDELDIELNLDDVSQDILNKAEKFQLTEDELEELDRQERDKSVIKDSERDLKELDRLENEIHESENALKESKVDEDKFLEQSNLEDQEKKAKVPDPNAFESINEIEKDIGKKYLDEEINNKENPYGLTEFDLEEVDELLNTGQKITK